MLLSKMQLTNYKKLFINILVGSLIGAAGIAVIAVLAGEFSEILGRALFTLSLVAVHALAALAYIDRSSKQNAAENLTFFNNTVFVLVVLSFFTSVFGVWELLPDNIVGKLYLTYGVALFASLHGELLAKTTGNETKTNNIVYANYALMAAVILLILPLIWLTDFEFGDFYYRLLSAAAIVDATLTILAVIFHKLYLQKNPQAHSQLFTPVYDASGKIVVIKGEQQPRRGLHPLLWVLIIFIGAQLILPMLFFMLGSFGR